MLPTTKEMAMQIVVMKEMHPKDTISKLAERLMFSPIFMINALDEGEKLGLFSRIKDEDQLTTVVPIKYSILMGLEFGKENFRIQNELVRVIASANKDKSDVESGTLDFWTRGIRPADLEIALHVLRKVGFIAKYDLVNPKDKDSTYTFYTMRVNEGKEWGKKQFTADKKKKGKKK